MFTFASVLSCISTYLKYSSRASCSGFCGGIAEQSINEAVITVPSYFNQAERRAMSRAAEAAGLRVLQLINDNTAGNNDAVDIFTVLACDG